MPSGFQEAKTNGQEFECVLQTLAYCPACHMYVLCTFNYWLFL